MLLKVALNGDAKNYGYEKGRQFKDNGEEEVEYHAPASIAVVGMIRPKFPAA